MLQIGNKVRATAGENKGRIGNVVGSIPLLNPKNPIKMMATQRTMASQGRSIIWTVKFDNGNLDSFEETELEPVSG